MNCSDCITVQFLALKFSLWKPDEKLKKKSTSFVLMKGSRHNGGIKEKQLSLRTSDPIDAEIQTGCQLSECSHSLRSGRTQTELKTTQDLACKCSQ